MRVSELVQVGVGVPHVFLHVQGLKSELEKASPVLGRSATYLKESHINGLPRGHLNISQHYSMQQEGIVAVFGNGLSTTCVVNISAQMTSLICIEMATEDYDICSKPHGLEAISICSKQRVSSCIAFTNGKSGGESKKGGGGGATHDQWSRHRSIKVTGIDGQHPKAGIDLQV